MCLSYSWHVSYIHAYSTCMCIFYFYFIYVVPEIEGSNVTIFENDGVAVVQFERSEQLDSDVMIYVTTVDGTAIG